MTCLVRIAARQPAIVAHFENATDRESVFPLISVRPEMRFSNKTVGVDARIMMEF